MSSPLKPSVKAAKKSAFSCDQCRKRKVKCGGEQPECDRCIIRKETCIYKLAPTLSYTKTLEAKVKDLERQLAQVRDQLPGGSALPSELICEPAAEDQETQSQGSHTNPPGSFDGLRVDHQGGITYHGATSFFMLPSPNPQHGSSEVASPKLDCIDEEERRERLIQNAWQQRALETLSQTPEPFRFLLTTHWCWIQPLFNFVYRPAFTRDMEVLGPYYSHTLLNAILSHSVRWCRSHEQIRQLLVPYDEGALFARQARTLLFEELKSGHCKVPTVQTLLLLSAHECSAGNRTQAWLYSGMAFRLIEDMGICIDGQKYAGSVQLSDEEVEIRHRLFWSCFFWDKMISLYLGRSPTLQRSNVSPPQIMLDDSAENELWTPHGLIYPDGSRYPPTQAHSISCFMRMCQLSVIFNQVLVHMYDPLRQNSEQEIQACLRNEGASLGRWWEGLPDFLRLDMKALPVHAPPSHIVTLNCLYHTFKILLYRPMLTPRSTFDGHALPEPKHLVECIHSATSIIAIYDLFIRTFGTRFCIMSLSYSVYTAASIFLLQLQAAPSPDEPTWERLKFCMHALDKARESSPVIESAMSLITDAISKLGINSFANLMTQNSKPTEDEFQKNSGLSQDFFLLTTNSEQKPKPHYDRVELYQTPIYKFNPDGFEISSEMLAAFSSLEPINATVGPRYDPGD